MPNKLHFGLGILLTLLITFIAYALNSILPLLGSAGWSIILGLLASPILVRAKSIDPSVKWVEKNILQIAISLMGTQLLWIQVLEAKYFFVLLLVIGALLMIIALKVLPKFGISKELSWLIAGGEAVCGSAAIGAASGSTKAKASEIALAILLVNGLSTIALFTAPALLKSLSLEPVWNAWFTGGYIQSAGHAIAASFGVDQETGVLGTAFKMGRIFLLVPLVLFSSYIFKKKENSNEKSRIKLPWFLYVFLIGFFLFNLFPALSAFRDHLKILADFLLNWALAAIGLHISLKGIISQGKPALFASIFLTTLHLLLLILVCILV